MKDDSVYLNHIGNCIARIQENTAKGYEEFIASHTLQDAVLRNLQVLAESTQHPPIRLRRRSQTSSGRRSVHLGTC